MNTVLELHSFMAVIDDEVLFWAVIDDTVLFFNHIFKLLGINSRHDQGLEFELKALHTMSLRLGMLK